MPSTKFEPRIPVSSNIWSKLSVSVNPNKKLYKESVGYTSKFDSLRIGPMISYMFAGMSSLNRIYRTRTYTASSAQSKYPTLRERKMHTNAFPANKTGIATACTLLILSIVSLTDGCSYCGTFTSNTASMPRGLPLTPPTNNSGCVIVNLTVSLSI